MIRRSFALFAGLSLAALTPVLPVSAQVRVPGADYSDARDRYSADELDNLVGPIALYPDALLAQVLVAATFPDQVDEAARFVRANGTSQIDDQPWDLSVKAVAHYPSALNMMANRADWTTTLGRAYASQSSDVMAAVQRMRAMADAQGNLRTTPEQQVTRDDDNYVIAPARERIIYVPVYDPYVVYTRPIFGLGYYSSFWSFGIGFPIGGWLSYDCNWRSRSVYYNGWDRAYYGYAGGWRARSAPYIHITNIYVNPRYRNVYINRDVIHRRIEYRNVDRVQGIHRDTRFGGRDGDYRDGRDRVRNVPDYNRPDDRARGGYGASGRTDDRGQWRRDDNRDNNRDNNRGSGTVPGGYDGGYRGRDQQRGNAGGMSNTNGNGSWNGGRDSRQSNDNGGRTIGDGRGGSIGGGRDDNGGRTIGDGRGGSLGGNRDNGGGRTIGDGRGGSIGGTPQGTYDGGNRGRDQQRDDSRGRDRGAPPGVVGGGWGRNERPNIDPRRAEPQPSPAGNGGQGGGQRGGRQGRERPIF